MSSFLGSVQTPPLLSLTQKTEITSTVTSDENKVPSCAAVSTALAGKLNTGSIAVGINDDNKNNDNIVPSVKAVADYVDSNVSGAMDCTAAKDLSNPENPIINVANSTDGLCAVRVTKMSDGSVQYKSNNFVGGHPSNTKAAFTFNISTTEHYMIEAWVYNNGKLIPTAVKYV